MKEVEKEGEKEPEKEREEWEKEIPKYEEKIEKEQKEKYEKVRTGEGIEKSYDLIKLCREFLEENCKTWEKRRDYREKEEERKIRLEKAGRKKRESIKTHLEKKIEKGLELLPHEEREKLEREDMREKRLELQQTKQSLWKLRNKEKKRKVEKRNRDEMITLEEKWRYIEEKIEEIRKEKDKLGLQLGQAQYKFELELSLAIPNSTQ